MVGRSHAVVALLVLGASLTACASGSDDQPTATSASPGTAASDTATSGAPPPAEAELNGTFRKEQLLTQLTTNSVPTPLDKDETYWWAFRSACLPTGCVATATALDDGDHTIAATPSLAEVYRFVYGGWESTSEMTLPCEADPNAVERLQKVVRYVPQPDGSLTGEDTRTITDDGCGRTGNVFVFPTSLTREGDVPAGVDVADPATIGG